MYRTVVSRLRTLKGHVGNLGPTRYATSSAVAARISSPGFFCWLTGEYAISHPPVNIPLEGVSLPPPLPDYVEPRIISSKTLANGARIVSEESSLPYACILIVVPFMKHQFHVGPLIYSSGWHLRALETEATCTL